jgi:hypothetical protein
MPGFGVFRRGNGHIATGFRDHLVLEVQVFGVTSSGLEQKFGLAPCATLSLTADQILALVG